MLIHATAVASMKELPSLDLNMFLLFSSKFCSFEIHISQSLTIWLVDRQVMLMTVKLPMQVISFCNFVKGMTEKMTALKMKVWSGQCVSPTWLVSSHLLFLN
jgi:hypothetical protein